MAEKGERLRARGIFALLSRRDVRHQELDLNDLLNGENRQELLDSADSLLSSFIVPRLLKHASGRLGSNKSYMVLRQTPCGYTFTLGAYTGLIASNIKVDERIVTVALGSAPEHNLIPSGDSKQASFTMVI